MTVMNSLGWALLFLACGTLQSLFFAWLIVRNGDYRGMTGQLMFCLLQIILMVFIVMALVLRKYT